jgi:hypothetical protein
VRQLVRRHRVGLQPAHLRVDVRVRRLSRRSHDRIAITAASFTVAGTVAKPQSPRMSTSLKPNISAVVDWRLSHSLKRSSV